jgi:hypothetical protein
MNCASGSRKSCHSPGNHRNRNCLLSGVNGTLITSDEMKHRLFMVVLVIAIVLAMTGWVYALGWVVLKLV